MSDPTLRPVLRPRELELGRRDDARVALSLFLDEYVGERHHRALLTNLSATGLHLSRLFGSGRGLLQLGREDRYVQLEFKLPGTSDSIWARGEIRYDSLSGPHLRQRPSDSDWVHATGVHLTDMARGHARLLKEFVEERVREDRIKRVEELLSLVRANRYH